MFLWVFVTLQSWTQSNEIARYAIHDTATQNRAFHSSLKWKGGDGAGSIDLGKGRVLWLFGDTFIGGPDSTSRNGSVIVRNSIAIQNGYDLSSNQLTFYWNDQANQPAAFFKREGNGWYWPGHGTVIGDRLLLFMMKIAPDSMGLGFKIEGWDAVLISNPHADPFQWKMKWIEGQSSSTQLIGSAAVVRKDDFVYAYAVDGVNHNVQLIRWNSEEAYKGDLHNGQWWTASGWKNWSDKTDIPQILFQGQTEFSVHYDAVLRQYIQIQTYGFGAASIGVRYAQHLQGKWSDPVMIYNPQVDKILQPLVYAAKAHPEQKGSGLTITVNINSLDFKHLLSNMSIYYPRVISILLYIHSAN